MLEHFKVLHAAYPVLQEQYSSLSEVLEINKLNYKLLLEFINHEKELKLVKILSKDEYAPIRFQYNLELKDVVLSSVILEQSLKYIIRKLYAELYKIFHKLNTPHLTINANDAAWDIQIIVTPPVATSLMKNNNFQIIAFKVGNRCRILAENHSITKK